MQDRLAVAGVVVGRFQTSFPLEILSNTHSTFLTVR
jgi:hypothetical protein